MKTQITPAILESIARKHNTTIRYGRYRMWFNVPFINNTALVVDNIVHGGGYRLLDVQAFLHPLSPAYIDAAITAGAHSLGELDLSKTAGSSTPGRISWGNTLPDTSPIRLETMSPLHN